MLDVAPQHLLIRSVSTSLLFLAPGLIIILFFPLSVPGQLACDWTGLPCPLDSCGFCYSCSPNIWQMLIYSTMQFGCNFVCAGCPGRVYRPALCPLIRQGVSTCDNKFTCWKRKEKKRRKISPVFVMREVNMCIFFTCSLDGHTLMGPCVWWDVCLSLNPPERASLSSWYQFIDSCCDSTIDP